MAHASTIVGLAGDLVTSITGTTSDETTFRSLKDQALKGLRDAHHGRTNPFEVSDRYTGLVEKFGVRNRDDLAEALQSRLDLLGKTQWTSEVLSLLLQLSDRPLENTHLEDLEGLTRPIALPAELTWEEIVADDPLSDEDIWDDVERGYHSSGEDDESDDPGSDPTTSTQATSLADDDFAAIARLHIIQPDPQLLDEVRAAKQTLDVAGSGAGPSAVSELSVIRESLAMLHGLPTYLFRVSGDSGAVALESKTAVATASDAIVRDALTGCANIGTRLNFVRRWAFSEQKAAYLQSIQAVAQRQVMVLGARIGEVEHGYLRPGEGRVVSIIEMRSTVESLTRPMLGLSDVLSGHTSLELPASPFNLLDALYAEACVARMTGDGDVFAVLASAMLAGLQTYLRPALWWVAAGTLSSQDSEHFFVQEHDPECDLGDVWHERYALRFLPDGKVCAPVMVQPFADSLYAMGKSKAFQRLLGQQSEPEIDTGPIDLQILDFASMASSLRTNPLLSFDDLLHERLSDIVHATASSDSSMTIALLLEEGGVLRTVKALQYVFFARDGALLQAFTESLFDRIRRGPKTWKDRFLLTRLAQTTLGTAPEVVVHSLDVNFSDAGNNGAAIPVLRQLEQLSLQYAFGWAVQNIVRSKQLPCQSSAFSFLLQLEYASYLLSTQLFDLRTLKEGIRRLSQAVQTAIWLRLRLLWLVGVLREHFASVTNLVSTELHLHLSEASDIDSMADIWQKHEKRLQVSLLLAPNLQPIRQAVTDLLVLCERLAGAWTLLSDGTSSPSMVTSLGEAFGKGLSFVSAGLRGVSRAGGETALEALAERLQWDAG